MFLVYKGHRPKGLVNIHLQEECVNALVNSVYKGLASRHLVKGPESLVLPSPLHLLVLAGSCLLLLLLVCSCLLFLALAYSLEALACSRLLGLLALALASLLSCVVALLLCLQLD